jgi:hypothetical protein
MSTQVNVNDVDIDLSSVGAAQETFNISSGIDTISISGIDLDLYNSNMATYSYSPGATVGGITTIGAAGTTSSLNYTSTAAWNNSYTISNGTNYGNVNINNTGIDMAADADIKIGNRSLKATMDKIEERLAILTPDPEKLAKFEALKKAYEHYKLMEKLCQIEDKEDK